MRWVSTSVVAVFFAAVFLGIAVKVWPMPAPVAVAELTGDAKRGAYLARMAGCVTCHTANGAAPLSGGAALESRFGSFFAPNITPDPEHGIGEWTFQQFARAIRQGISPEGSPYYPAFPYEFYSELTDRDLADLWAAIRATPSSPKPSDPHRVGFPFNVRDGIRIWRTFFVQSHTFVEDPAKSAAWNRGKFIVDGPAHCGACHTPRNVVGGLAAGMPLTGDPAMQDGGSSPAITKKALTARGWTKDSLVTAFRTGVLPDGDSFGGSMSEVVHGSTTYWLSQHLEDMATYLLDLDEGPRLSSR